MTFKKITRVKTKDGTLGPPTNIMHLLKELWLMVKEIYDDLAKKK